MTADEHFSGKVVIDFDQNSEDEQLVTLLENLGVESSRLSTLSDDEILENIQEEQVLLFTPLSTDWLGYHKKFVKAHKKHIKSWIVVFTGSNHIAATHMKWFFEEESLDLHFFNLSEKNVPEFAAELKNIKIPRTNSLLLYSINPSCGKNTLKELLEKYLLPDWIIETVEEDVNNPFADVLEQSDAAVKVIVSDKFDMLHYKKLPESVHPLFVLTMPDKNVALYLQVKNGNWAKKDLESLANKTTMTAEGIEKRLFFLSPLYETWRLSGINPSNDVRFAMWDDFGLPIPRSEYSDSQVRDFLLQFIQGEKLATAIKS